ncbi:MAG: DUF309 domain-containing protein [Xenococcaceae cyanobacterium MO_188.B32]|nr:DUF309 domain-containing protein [Xenococcaceae cyanobacterium MO_188.B32]
METFWQGVEEFNQQHFYACHDILEAIWIDAEEIDKKFYQGILQIAVACYHLGNHNWRGAVILLGEGISRLTSYQPIYHSINVTELVRESYQLLQGLQKIESEQVEEFVRQLQSNNTLDNNEIELGTETVYKLPQIKVIEPQ